MGKMKELVVDQLETYELNLHAYGHADPLVQVLKRDLLALRLDLVTEEVMCIDHEFDTLVFNNS
jgi:hypothetical protein